MGNLRFVTIGINERYILNVSVDNYLKCVPNAFDCDSHTCTWAYMISLYTNRTFIIHMGAWLEGQEKRKSKSVVPH